MSIFNRRERREKSGWVDGDELLRQLVGTTVVTPEMAMQIPSYAASVDFIAGTVAGLPVKLYRENGSQAQEITDDPRTDLLNGYTRDELYNTGAMLRAMIRDYFNHGAGYAFIERRGNAIAALHYVAHKDVSATPRVHPIYHDADFLVAGVKYRAYDFIRIVRDSVDGVRGIGIPEQSPTQLAAAHAALRYELQIMKQGGNKKGVLKSEKRLDEESMRKLKEAWAGLYSQDSNNMLILNNGLDFKETSSSAVDLQMNENKTVNAGEIARLFLLSPEVLSGRATAEQLVNAIRTAVMPIITILQDAINDAMLLEAEKPEKYFAVDTTELMRGDILKRYQAYQIALDANFLQPDEVRYREDLPPLGLDFIKLGLNDVLYDPKTKSIYTPNTGVKDKISGEGGRQDEN